MDHCPFDGAPMNPHHYLCPSCWPQLPAATRRALYRRDRQAGDRLRTLYRLIQDGIPLRQIVIT